jgi:hypothetical protein
MGACQAHLGGDCQNWQALCRKPLGVEPRRYKKSGWQERHPLGLFLSLRDAYLNILLTALQVHGSVTQLHASSPVAVPPIPAQQLLPTGMLSGFSPP